jgi:hypothetical protein
MNNDNRKRVMFKDNGIPVGSNGAIAEALGKLFGFSPNMITNLPTPILDRKTGKAAGMYEEVHFTFLFKCSGHNCF